MAIIRHLIQTLAILAQLSVRRPESHHQGNSSLNYCNLHLLFSVLQRNFCWWTLLKLGVYILPLSQVDALGEFINSFLGNAILPFLLRDTSITFGPSVCQGCTCCCLITVNDRSTVRLERSNGTESGQDPPRPCCLTATSGLGNCEVQPCPSERPGLPASARKPTRSIVTEKSRHD